MSVVKAEFPCPGPGPGALQSVPGEGDELAGAVWDGMARDRLSGQGAPAWNRLSGPHPAAPGGAEGFPWRGQAGSSDTECAGAAGRNSRGALCCVHMEELPGNPLTPKSPVS